MRKKLFLVSLFLLATAIAYAGEPVANPYLSSKTYGVTHFDPASTDSIPYPIVKGTFNFDLQKQSEINGGPVNIMTLASPSPDYMWAVSSQGVTYVNVANGQFKEVARLNAPEMKIVSAETHKKLLTQKFKTVAEVQKAVKDIYGMNYTRIYNGIYSVVDNENVIYANYTNYIYAFGLVDPKDPSKGIKILRQFSPRTFMDSKEFIAAVDMTYDGNLVIVTTRNVAVIDRQFKNKPVIFKINPDENITNSIAIDEKNALYVASDKNMRKIAWDGKTLSVDEKKGGWISPYQSGQQPPSVKVGGGTGATPTLMGFGNDPDKLVVITDGADRMNIVAFWRDAIPQGFKQKPGTLSNRIADQLAVTCGLPKDAKWVQTEQSVVVKNYGAFVINNIVESAPADRLEGVVALGPVIAPPKGMERFEWDPKAHKWASVWTNPNESSISTVPAVSIPSNIVLVNGYSKERGWEVTGMDWDTGKVVHRTIFGFDNYGNGAYSLIQLFPNGDLLFNSIAGPFRLKYPTK